MNPILAIFILVPESVTARPMAMTYPGYPSPYPPTGYSNITLFLFWLFVFMFIFVASLFLQAVSTGAAGLS